MSECCKKDLLEILNESVKNAYAVKSEYTGTSQSLASSSNNEIILSRAEGKLNVNYCDKTANMTSQITNTKQSVTTETIYKKYCVTETITTVYSDGSPSTASSNTMAVMPNNYKQYFCPGGILWPIDTSGLVPMCNSSCNSDKCQTYSIKPELLKCMEEVMNSTVNICMVNTNSFEVTTITNTQDKTTGQVLVSSMINKIMIKPR